VGISAFQLAQFGHGYSALFLAVVAARSAEDQARFTVLMDVVFDAWRHGRHTPPLIAIPWEQVWNEPTEAVRARFGITPFASPYPADLFEQPRAA
jgi:ubiquinone biosynthesis protein Coq4